MIKNTEVPIEKGLIPEGYIPIRYGKPKIMETYLTPEGDITTAYHCGVDKCYLIVVEEMLYVANSPSELHTPEYFANMLS